MITTTGARLEPGDSGSPAYIDFSRPVSFSPYFDRLLRERHGFVSYNSRLVLGIAQKIEVSGGRYVVTFGTGGPTGRDRTGAPKPRISEWLNNLLYDELVAYTRDFPGVPRS